MPERFQQSTGNLGVIVADRDYRNQGLLHGVIFFEIDLKSVFYEIFFVIPL
jgi:hypothetical protein